MFMRTKLVAFDHPRAQSWHPVGPKRVWDVPPVVGSRGVLARRRHGVSLTKGDVLTEGCSGEEEGEGMG